MHQPRRLLPFALALLVAAASGAVVAQESWPTLDPRTDVSPAGTCTLRVEPSSPSGRGPAHYRLERGGTQLWAADLDVTFWKSVVADDGTVAGFGYGNGPSGWSGERGDFDRSNFRVVILDPAGLLRLDLSFPRHDSQYMHDAPHPLGLGVLLDPDDDCVVVRMDDEDINRGSEEWWPFRLSTGAALPKIHPRDGLPAPATARWVLDVRHVKQTPLCLLHWWTFDDSSDEWAVGGRFVLMGLDGSVVWTFDRPNDYTVPGNQDASDRLQDKIRQRGAILNCAEPGRFEIGLVGEGQRVSFEVKSQEPVGNAPPDVPMPLMPLPFGKHWAVTELSRAAWSLDAPVAHPEPIAEGHLEEVGTLDLAAPAAAGSQLGPIGHFDVDDRGRFGFTRTDGTSQSFVLAGPDGAVFSTWPLDLHLAREDGSEARLDAEWLTGDRWLIYASWPGASNANPAWWLDVATGRIDPIPGFELPAIKAIDGDGHGGFVALGSVMTKYSMEYPVAAFDANGALRWKLAEDSEDRTLPLSPEDIAVASDGRVGVLDVIRKLLLIYDTDGRYAETIDLQQRWGWEPEYPTGLTAEPGGWVVHDFNGQVPLVRMSSTSDGFIRLHPAFADGRVLDLLKGRVTAALDGGLWTTDGHAFLHLNSVGQVDRMAGRAPDPERIDAVAGVVFDTQGRILVGDGRTGAVHVFDAKGAPLFVCRPAPQDAVGCEELAAAPDGRIFAGGEHGFLAFSPQGERVGPSPRLLEIGNERWLFQPHGGRRWVVGYDGIVLADADGKVVRKIEKRADGTWLQHPDDSSMAPDGSLAVISDGICLVDPAGEPREQIALPAGTKYGLIAFDGRRLLLATQEALFLRVEGGTWKRYAFPSKLTGFMAVAFAPDGERIRLALFQSARILDVRLLD